MIQKIVAALQTEIVRSGINKVFQIYLQQGKFTI